MPVVDPKQVESDLHITTDVCIIGSGAGGAISAAKLTEKGHSVVILEEGPFVDQKTFDQNEKRLLKLLYRFQGGLTTDDASIRILQGRCFGGSTTVNWMTCLRTPDIVLEEWANDFGLEEYLPKYMSSHFEAVEKRLSVHVVPDEEHNTHNRIILEGCKNLGIHAKASSNNSIDCIGCGYCGMGCSYDAKQDMRLTYLKDALEKEAIVHVGTRAERIQYLSKDQQVIEAITLGEEYGVPSRVVKVTTRRTIVSGSAIWTPVILQKSKMTKSKVVGKYLHIHPVTLALGLFDHHIDPSYGIPQSTYSKEYWNLDGNGYGFWLEVPPVQPIMGGVNFPGIGKERRALLKQFRNIGVILVLTRDGANKKSSGRVKWARGKLSVKYSLSKEDKAHLMKGLENALEVLFAAGAIETYTMHVNFLRLTSPKEIPRIHQLPNGPNQLALFSAHPTGTARMGKDPKNTVVNERMEMHHYPGVYVMDGSVLPTAPGVNPMITILSCVSRAHELNGDFDL